MAERSAVASPRWSLLTRFLHWSMAVMVTSQFFIGVVMVTALVAYPRLIAIHRPLGFMILVFAVFRVINRLVHRAPPFPSTMGRTERLAATLSEYAMYALLLIQPVVGWAMLSATETPVKLVGSLNLPDIAPSGITVYAVLRMTHSVLAYALFAAFTTHICAVVFHTIGLRDRMFARMAMWSAHRAGPDAANRHPARRDPAKSVPAVRTPDTQTESIAVEATTSGTDPRAQTSTEESQCTT